MSPKDFSEPEAAPDAGLQKGFDWSTMARVVDTHARAPVNAHSSSLHASVMGALGALKEPPYPVNFHFKWKGRSKTVSLRFKSPLQAPRRDEPVLLSFLDDDDGKVYRVSSFADHTIQNYYDARTLTNIDQDGLILDIWLKPVTVQPTREEIAREYDKKYSDVPSLEEFESGALSKVLPAK